MTAAAQPGSSPAPTRRAVIYARFSSDLQNERSIADQQRLCRDWAAGQGFTIVADYADAAQSGSTLFGRNGLLRLLAGVRAEGGPGFDAVIVESIDRLARNQRDIADIFQQLEFAGIEIQSVQEGRIEELHIGLKGTMDALFLKGHRIKTKRGHVGAIREGRAACGLVYGYRLVPGQPGVWQIDEDQAAIVRRVYDAYAAGDSIRTITKRLNDEGVPTARGGKWSTSTVAGNMKRRSGLLANPIYRGQRIYNRQSFPRDPVTGRKIARLNPESEWTWQDVPELAIITEEQWNTVQAIKAGHKARRPETYRRSRVHLLSGVMRCGSCGGAMVVRTKRKAATVYGCSARLNSGTCDVARYVRDDAVLPRVTTALRAHLTVPEALQVFVDAYREEWTALTGERRGSLDRQRRAVIDAEQKVERLLEVVETGVVSTALIERLRARESELAQAKAQLAQTESAQAPLRLPHPENLARRWAETLDELDALMESDVTTANTALRQLLQARISYKNPTAKTKEAPLIAITITGAPSTLEPGPTETPVSVPVGSERET